MSYEKHYPAIRGHIFLHVADEDDRQNALAWSWEVYCERISAGFDSASAARQASTMAVRRAYQPFTGGGRRWRECVALGGAEPARADIPAPDKVAERFSAHLRQLVALLACGTSKADCADVLGVSRATVSRRCEEIERELVAGA